MRCVYLLAGGGDVRPALVMEYYPWSLHRLMSDADLASLLTPKVRAMVAREVAQGMAYLHALAPPVIHRDLKPVSSAVLVAV